MEQQLKPNSPKYTLCVYRQGGDDEEEEELAAGLLPRHSRHPTSGVETTSTSTTTGGELEPATLPDPAANGTATSEHYDQDEEQEAKTADESRENEEVVGGNEEDKVVKGEGDGIGNSVYFDKLQGIWKCRHCNWTHQIGSPCILDVQNPKWHMSMDVKTLNQCGPCFILETKDVNVDLIGESEEDLMELDVERVLETQNTHDLYCPNCNSCITRRVILRVKKSDPIPISVGGAGSIDNGTGQEQQAFSCPSCFSLFIPIGNGCFKIFQFFMPGGRTEPAHSQPEPIKGKILSGTTETHPNVSHNEDTQSPSKISRNEDTQSHQKISHDENTQSPQSINQNENKQSPQKIPTAWTNWIFSVFGFLKSKATFTKDSSIVDKVKAVARETKPDVDAGKNGIIADIEPGLLEPMEPATSSRSRTQDEPRSADAGEAQEWEILKSIVYGGLIESLTSLGVVSSAAGAGADTLNVLALAVANLIGGLLVIGHNLRELKNDQPRGTSNEINIEEDRYQALLGRRQNFVLHFTVAIISFLIFGLIPPVVYGFSFLKSDDKNLKLAAVAGASLACIILLALGKGHVQKPRRTYFRTLSYYVVLGITTSGISYVVGELIRKLLEKLGLFESSSAVSVPFFEPIPFEVGRSSY